MFAIFVFVAVSPLDLPDNDPATIITFLCEFLIEITNYFPLQISSDLKEDQKVLTVCSYWKYLHRDKHQTGALRWPGCGRTQRRNLEL